jgi:probable F420-dependent oxidoreductase
MATAGAAMSKLELGPVGAALTVSDAYLDRAAELEHLGYSALWLPGGQIDDLNRLAEIIGATTAVPVASAIISLDVYPAAGVAGLYAQLETSAPGRLVAGLGGPQQPHPLPALNDYLDHLDRADPPVPAGRRLLGALGPRKLQLARDRCAGAILLLVTPAYTSAAREIIGGDSTLVIDQMLVLDTDAARARQTARRPLRFLSGLPGYRASFARMGFTDGDIDGLSDALVDQLLIWGDAATIADRIGQYRQAGADHVMLHVLSEGDQPGPVEVARRLAGSLAGQRVQSP